MEVPDTLKLAIELAERTASSGGRVGKFAQEMARLLTQVLLEIELTGAGIASPRSRKGALEYVVETIGGQETLVEHRVSGKANPFRCPKDLYEAVAAALADAERPYAVEDIASKVETILGDRPAEFQLRVPLRLWLHAQPQLISRNRARYRPTNASAFQITTADLWTGLRRNLEGTSAS